MGPFSMGPFREESAKPRTYFTYDDVIGVSLWLATGDMVLGIIQWKTMEASTSYHM